MILKRSVAVLFFFLFVFPFNLVISEEEKCLRDEKIVDVSYLNNPPENVSISGPVFGKSGELNEYSFYCDDPEGDNVSYYIKWESSCPTVYGPFESSIPINLSYLWKKSGFYTISFKAVDEYGGESEIVYFDMVMPINKNSQYLSILNYIFNIFYEKSLI